ncbi:MAG: hypothetical protein HQM10_14445 [Candidatus Riflebacteria bacterium]|nr:hypothetical protein [Candidatus Riflebacteria bacterium]
MIKKRLLALADLWGTLLLSHPRCFGPAGIESWEKALLNSWESVSKSASDAQLVDALNSKLLNNLSSPLIEAEYIECKQQNNAIDDNIIKQDYLFVRPCKKILLIKIMRTEWLANKKYTSLFFRELETFLSKNPVENIVFDFRLYNQKINWIPKTFFEGFLSQPSRSQSLHQLVHCGWNEDFNDYVYYQSWKKLPGKYFIAGDSEISLCKKRMIIVLNRSSIALLSDGLPLWRSKPNRRIVFETSGRWNFSKKNIFEFSEKVLINIPVECDFEYIDLITSKDFDSNFEEIFEESFKFPDSVRQFVPPDFPSGSMVLKDNVDSTSTGHYFVSFTKIWNILRKFSPTFIRLHDTGEKWFLKKVESLIHIANDKDFRNFLKKIAGELPDNHSGVYFPDEKIGILPLKLVFAGEKLYGIGKNFVGEITHINLVPLRDFRETFQKTSGSSTPQFEKSSFLKQLSEGYPGEKIMFRLELTKPSPQPSYTETPARGSKIESASLIEDCCTIDMEFTYQEDKPEEPLPSSSAMLFSEPEWAKTLDILKHEIVLLRPFDLADTNDLFEVFNFIVGKAKKLIIDLRGYPKKHFQVSLASCLTKSSIRLPACEIPVVTASDRNSRKFEHVEYRFNQNLTSGNTVFEGPVIALIDESTVSASEFTGLVIKMNRKVTFVGRPTAGNCGNASFIRLFNGSHFLFTGMDVFDSDGTLFEGRGLLPDILVERSIKGILEKRDEILERAIREFQTA